MGTMWVCWDLWLVFMFLLSANYGQLDTLADDGSASNLKFRLISWIAPVALIAVYLPIYFIGESIVTIISYNVVMFFLINASRYHLKHLIIPDVELPIGNRGHRRVNGKINFAEEYVQSPRRFDKRALPPVRPESDSFCLKYQSGWSWCRCLPSC